MHKLLFPFALAALAATAQAEVSCKIGGAAIAATDVQTMFHYSASGQRGANGRLSHFRLMTDDNAAGKSSGVELKTVDVTTPGDYELSTESGWRSAIMVQGKRQYVTTGKFTFTHFEVKGSRGRAAGTLEFTTTQTRGECRFSIEIQAFDRDTVGR